MGLWVHSCSNPRKTSSEHILLIQREFPAHFLLPPRKTRSRLPHTDFSTRSTMQLEFHQLDRRWEHLRVRRPDRQRRLLASLAESGQQDADRSGGPRRSARPLPGDRRLQAHRGAAATGTGHGGSGGLAHERGRGVGAALFQCCLLRREAQRAVQGCWRNWSSVSAMVSMSWRDGLIAA